MNPLNPILPTTMRTEVYDESRIIHKKIQSNDLSDLRLTITRDGTTWFRGLLKSVDGGANVRHDNPKLRLVWNDCLPFLKSQPFRFSGRSTTLDAVTEVLSNSRSGLDGRIALAWEDTAADTSNGRSEAFQHAHGQELQRGSQYDWLTQTAKYFNLQIFQEDGLWRIIHRSYRDASSLDYEQTDGTTGSVSPSVSISDSDWYSGQKSEVLEESLDPKEWVFNYETSAPPFNGDFQRSTTVFGGSAEAPQHWHVSSTNLFNAAENRVEIAGSNGIDTATPQEVERPLEDLFQYDDTSRDEVTLTAKGTVVVNDTGEAGFVDVSIVRLIAVQPETGSTFYYDSGSNSWDNSSLQEITVSIEESNSGTQDRDFTRSLRIEAPSPTTAEEDFIYQVQLISEQDPDGDGNNEISEVRFDSVKFTDITRNANEDPKIPSGAGYELEGLGEEASESLSIGTVRWPGDEREALTGKITLRYLDSNGDWRPLHYGSNANHASRSYDALKGLDELRMRDRYAMWSRPLSQLIGVQKWSVLSLRDTISYDGKTYLPYFIDQWLRSEYRVVGLVELRNDSVTNNDIEFRPEP